MALTVRLRGATLGPGLWNPGLGEYPPSSLQFIDKVYNVMQSDWNSFWKMSSRDEDKFLDQIYISKYVRIIIMMILILYNIMRKCILALQ